MTSILLIVDSLQERDKNFEQAILDADYIINEVIQADDDFLQQIQKCQSDILLASVEKVRIELMQNIALVSKSYPVPVIIFTPDANHQAIDNAIQSGVSAYIVDGFKANRIRPIIEIALSRFKVVHQLQSELAETKQRLNDRKLIDKAKGLLMQEKNIPEEDAYQLIRKMAMNKSTSMAQVSSNIIDVYELMA